MTGKRLEMQWILDAPTRDAEELEPVSPTSQDDRDPMGLDELRAGWVPPALGRGRSRRLYSLAELQRGMFVAVLTEADDEYSFEVEGRLVWLGKVRHLV